jgi:hypothetical protein
MEKQEKMVSSVGPVIVGVQGEDKSGKTSFALSLPKPIYHMELDVGGFRRAAWRWQEDVDKGDIVSKVYRVPQSVLRERLLGGLQLKKQGHVVGAKELWYEILEDVIGVCEGRILTPDGREFATIGMDSYPEVWNTCHRSYLQELQEIQKDRVQLMSIEYGEPNSRMGVLAYGIKDSGKNLVLTNYMTDKYETVLSGGSMKEMVVGRTAAGWKQLTKIVDVLVETRIKGGESEGEVMLCGLAMELTGMKFKNPTWGMVEQAVGMFRGQG